MTEQNREKLKALAEEVCLRENVRLYDIELVGQGKGRILRVFIEKMSNGIPAEGADESLLGVSLTDCSNVSHGLSLQLDVEEIIPGGSYNLEVSSPGVERRLTQQWHYQTVLNKSVRIWLKRPLKEFMSEQVLDQDSVLLRIAKSLKLDAILKSCTEDQVVVEFNGVQLEVPFLEIERAKTLVEFSKAEKPGSSKNRKPDKKSNKGKKR